jgi:hypothetical protein
VGILLTQDTFLSAPRETLIIAGYPRGRILSWKLDEDLPLALCYEVVVKSDYDELVKLCKLLKQSASEKQNRELDELIKIFSNELVDIKPRRHGYNPRKKKRIRKL